MAIEFYRWPCWALGFTQPLTEIGTIDKNKDCFWGGECSQCMRLNEG
jgi:hypothetical protein